MNWTIWIHMLELEMVQYHRQDCTIYADVAVRSVLEPVGEKPFRRPETKWLFRTCSNYFLVSEIAVVFQSLNLNVPCSALQCLAVLESSSFWVWEAQKPCPSAQLPRVPLTLGRLKNHKDTMDQPVGLPTALPGVEDSGRWAGDGRWDYEKVLDVVKQWT